MDRWRAEQGRGREKRQIRRKKSRRKKMQMRERDRKGRKVAKHFVFPMIWGSGGSQSRLAKAAGAEPAGQMRDEKLHAVVARSTFRSENAQNTSGSDRFWQLRCRKSARRCGAKQHEAHFEVKMYKAHQVRTTFGSWDVEKVHAVMARSTFWSQNVQNTPSPDHFWQLRCRKKCTPLWREAHFEVKMYKAHHLRTIFGIRDVEKMHAVVARSSTKDILKSKCTKHTRFGPLLEVEMSKKCTLLWREAHFKVKMHKTPHVRATFGGSDVEKVDAVVVRSTFRSQTCKTLQVLSLFFTVRCRKSRHWLT